MKRTYTILTSHDTYPTVHLFHDKRDVARWFRDNGVREMSDAATGQCIYRTADGAWVMVFDRGPQIIEFAPTLPGMRLEPVPQEASGDV